MDSQSSIGVETKQVWKFDTSDISWLDWHSGASNVLFAGTEESELWMWKVPSGDSKVYMGSGEKVEAAILMPDGKRIAVAYGDGNIKMFARGIFLTKLFVDFLSSRSGRNRFHSNYRGKRIENTRNNVLILL